MYRRQTSVIFVLIVYTIYLLMANIYEILTGQVTNPSHGSLLLAVTGRGSGRDSSRWPAATVTIPKKQRHQQDQDLGGGNVTPPTGSVIDPFPVRHVTSDSGDPEKGEDGRIWPRPFREETDDRIMAQLAYVPRPEVDAWPDVTLQSMTSYKTILVYNNQEPSLVSGSLAFAECPVTRCAIAKNVAMAHEADAILFQNGVPDNVPEVKPANQIWILYLLEAPLHTQRLHHLNGLINWTATYRRDSTLVTPYEKFVLNKSDKYSNNRKKTGRSHPAPGGSGLTTTKTRKIAWFVSNCYTSNGRMEYVRELQRHIEVDIYGDCGYLKCPRGRHEDECHRMLSRDYFFYLAFENSNCRDYITEKFFHNALANHVVPVVMGAAKEDYTKVAPPGSFIHVDDFANPEELASFLDYLIRNQTAYLDYFSWKGSGTFIDTRFWCRLCSLLHGARRHVTWYDDIEAWWNGPDVCRTSRGTQKWSSWMQDAVSRRPKRRK